MSLFLVFAVGFALVQAEEAKEPRGPKITSKVIDIDVLARSICTILIFGDRSTSIFSMEMSPLVAL